MADKQDKQDKAPSNQPPTVDSRSSSGKGQRKKTIYTPVVLEPDPTPEQVADTIAETMTFLGTELAETPEANLDKAMRIGKYILDKFFEGDQFSFIYFRRHSIPFAALEDMPELNTSGVSFRTLKDYVRIYLMAPRLALPSELVPELGTTNRIRLLPIWDEALLARALAKECAQQKWGVDRLKREIEARRRPQPKPNTKKKSKLPLLTKELQRAINKVTKEVGKEVQIGGDGPVVLQRLSDLRNTGEGLLRMADDLKGCSGVIGQRIGSPLLGNCSASPAASEAEVKSLVNDLKRASELRWFAVHTHGGDQPEDWKGDIFDFFHEADPRAPKFRCVVEAFDEAEAKARFLQNVVPLLKDLPNPYFVDVERVDAKFKAARNKPYPIRRKRGHPSAGPFRFKGSVTEWMSSSHPSCPLTWAGLVASLINKQRSAKADDGEKE